MIKLNGDYDNFSILIVGCGELGSRHLQAVASLPIVDSVDLVDPNTEALEKSRKRLEDVSDRSPRIRFRWFSTLEDVNGPYDLSIVATQARGRCQLVENIFRQTRTRRFLIEKIVAQSIIEYQNLMHFAKENSLSVWINCKGRAHPSHKRVKENLKKGEPIVFTTVGGNHGLANNGIHAADLFSFFSGEEKVRLVADQIEPFLHPSQKRPGTFDLSGTLHGCTDRGSQFFLSFTGPTDGPAQFSIATPSYRSFVDDFMKFFYESKKESAWIWEKIPYEANLMVSNMTKTFASDILKKGTCGLPTLEECWPAHRFILESLQPHFNRLLEKDLGYCPVT